LLFFVFASALRTSGPQVLPLSGLGKARGW